LAQAVFCPFALGFRCLWVFDHAFETLNH
jgi:hypothetical protein